MCADQCAATKLLIVVSYYDARPHDLLHNLLRQLDEEVSAAKRQVVVVVNSVRDGPTPLPSLKAKVSLVYRENLGMNIGAWDHAWRIFPDHDRFLFLQDECVIMKSGWLRAYENHLENKEVGLVGESLGLAKHWDRILAPGAKKLERHRALYEGIKSIGINPGEHATHLQSLIWATRRDVLEAINGFHVGRDRAECIAAEVGCSRKIAGRNLKLMLAGTANFEWISHPQWDARLADPH
jgi:hypothetical protein